MNTSQSKTQKILLWAIILLGTAKGISLISYETSIFLLILFIGSYIASIALEIKDGIEEMKNNMNDLMNR